MKRKVTMGIFALATALLAAWLLLFPAAAKAEPPIKVGIIDTYTGPPTTYTYDVRDAFKLAVDELNAKGGILGRKVEFTTRDDKFKVDIGLSHGQGTGDE